MRRADLLRHLLSGRHAAAVRVAAGVHSGAGAVRLRHRLPADADNVLAGEGHPRPVAASDKKGAEAPLRRAAAGEHPADRGGGDLPAVPADERADPAGGGQRHHPHQQRGVLLPEGIPLGAGAAEQQQRDRRLAGGAHHRAVLRRHGLPDQPGAAVGAEGHRPPDQRHLERHPRGGGLRLRPDRGHHRVHLSDGHEGKKSGTLLQGGVRRAAGGKGRCGDAGHPQGQQHFLRLCAGQAAGLPYHRHSVLHLLLPAEDALHPAGKRGGRRDQRDPLLRPLPGRGALRVPDPAGQPQAVPGVRDLHRHIAAV